ncbi:MAG: glycosyltransferase family 9 protein, partial [Opitutaceae bacterium]|nr:glycosyltransferase family 9 protein [Opitutaceae bacterium]
SRFRIWPTERFAAVCDRLQDELDAQIFLIAGPGERAIAQEIRHHAQSHLVLIEEAFTTGQFTAFIAQFDLMLCHDSGPMHIAAGVGTKVVALFGSQNATIWSPVGEGHTTLQTDLPCACLPDLPTPCVRDDSYRSYCVRRLSPDQVFAAATAALKP